MTRPKEQEDKAKNKRGDRKEESTDSPETPVRRTSGIPGFLSRVQPGEFVTPFHLRVCSLHKLSAQFAIAMAEAKPAFDFKIGSLITVKDHRPTIENVASIVLKIQKENRTQSGRIRDFGTGMVLLKSDRSRD